MSDIMISYGNNSYVSKIFVKDIIQKKFQNNPDKYIIMNFNAYIHTTEDRILKDICKQMDIDTERPGFTEHQHAIEEYYKNNKIPKKFIVIFFENIEHLFFKKKQILIYSLLEIVNVSHSLLFCGMTNNFNLMDLMEKRIRSRFSQKTIYINIESFENLIFGIEKLFGVDDNSLTNNSKFLFFDFLISNEDFIKAFKKYFDMGMGVKEILTKVKYILAVINLEISKEKTKEIFTFEEKLKKMINNCVEKYLKEDSNGSYYTLLKSINNLYKYMLDFPKAHITILIMLLRAINRHKYRITAGMIYKEYSDCLLESNKNNNLNRTKLDLIIIKKILEELGNSNLLYIKSDEKYLSCYELKLTIEETKSSIMKLENDNYGNFDHDLKNWLASIK